MARLLLCCIILPAFASAGISIQVKGEVDEKADDLLVQFSGNQVDVVSDTEKNTFQMSGSNLYRGVQVYFKRRPQSLYLRNPTPWGNKFSPNGMTPVIRTLEPISARVLKISSQPAIVRTQVFVNNSTKTAIYTVGITQEVQNTASSTWSTGGSRTVGSEISYEFDFSIGKVGATMSLSYTSSWGKEVTKSETVTFGASSSVQIELKPGESVKAELQASKGAMQIEVEYEATLTGCVLTNYDPRFRGHHFWSLDIRAVMEGANLTYTMPSKEVITVGYFSDGQILVHDNVSGAKLLQRPVILY